MDEMTPEQIQQLMDMGVLPDQLEDIAKQRELAESIRYGQGPEGRQAGRTFVAASPLEHIGAFMQKRKAQKQLDELSKQRGDIYNKQSAGRGMYGRIIAGMGGGRPPMPGSEATGPMGPPTPMAPQGPMGPPTPSPVPAMPRPGLGAPMGAPGAPRPVARAAGGLPQQLMAALIRKKLGPRNPMAEPSILE